MWIRPVRVRKLVIVAKPASFRILPLIGGINDNDDDLLLFHYDADNPSVPRQFHPFSALIAPQPRLLLESSSTPPHFGLSLSQIITSQLSALLSTSLQVKTDDYQGSVWIHSQALGTR